MERLTKMGADGWTIGYPYCKWDAFDHLAAYEDTGLTPEQCAEYAKAEREGRLVVLPSSKARKERGGMIEHDGCVGCKYEHEDEASPHCDKCTQNSTDKYTPASNADRIRGMTDEELAEFLSNIRDCGDYDELKLIGGVRMDYVSVIEWLQQPVKEGCHEVS